MILDAPVLKVDLVTAKDRLLDITAELTCGIVNGRRMRVRQVIKPPWAEKRPERNSELSLDDDNDEPHSVLSKDQLKVLKNQQGWPHFKDVFMLSSVDKEDVDTLKVPVRLLLTKYLTKMTHPTP